MSAWTLPTGLGPGHWATRRSTPPCLPGYITKVVAGQERLPP